jgi:multisubunit Na+/H+ antiporter MnhG subunit
MKPLAVVVGILLGGFLGYTAGAFLACEWLWPTSNMSGIAGVFITGPLGAMAGAVAAERKLMRPLTVVVGTLIGGLLGFAAGPYACVRLWPISNLCGLVGVFITGPLGAIAGAVAAERMVRPQKK